DRPPAASFSRNLGDVVAEWQRRLGADWGLPVALFAMTLVAIQTFNTPIGVPLLVFAYVLARAHVTHSPDRITGRKRWLAFCPLAIGSGVLTGLVLGFPLTFRGVRASYADQFETLWVLGSWWVLVGILASREPRRVRSALKPFADTFDASHGRMLSLIGAAFLIASSVVLLSR